MTDDTPRRPALDRRSFLKAASVTAGSAAVASPTLLTSSASASSGYFLHGVASGDPLPNGVLLWTRVTPTLDATPGSGLGPTVSVTWQVATDSTFSGVVASGAVTTGPERDHTVKVDVTGLSPATTYWYRFSLDGVWSPVGRTRTAPAADADVASLRFGVVSCSNWEAGHFAAYRRLAARTDLQLMVHLGDYIYEYGTGQYDSGGTVVRVVQPVNETITLRDYRIRHGHYKTDPYLQQLHASVPWLITWDDHEIANDTWSGGAENHDPLTEGSWAARKAAAQQAYAEWMPVRLATDGSIYRRLRFGRLAEFAMLDLRSYRSKQASGSAVFDPARTITGDNQMSWLKSGLSQSTTHWKLVGNSVMISPLSLLGLPSWLLGPIAELFGAGALGSDQWDGYDADRAELISHIRTNALRNVVFLTGDIHSSWANEVVTTDSGSPPAAVEFVVPSVTSDNVDDILGWPSNSATVLAAPAIQSSNPHVRWVDTDRHGYGVCTVTSARTQMDWYFLANRRDAASTASWARGYSVASGATRLERMYAPA